MLCQNESSVPSLNIGNQTITPFPELKILWAYITKINLLDIRFTTFASNHFDPNRMIVFSKKLQNSQGLVPWEIPDHNKSNKVELVKFIRPIIYLLGIRSSMFSYYYAVLQSEF